MEKATKEIIYLYDEDIQQCTINRIYNKKISHYDLIIDDIINEDIRNIAYNDENIIVVFKDKILNSPKVYIV
jgi:hypothetical protein